MNDLSDDDFFNDSGPSQDDAPLKLKAGELVNLMDSSSELAEMTKANKSSIHKLRSVELPSIVDDLGIEGKPELTVGNRRFVLTVDTAVESTLPKDQEKRQAKLDALMPLGVGELITEELKVELRPDDPRSLALRIVLGLFKDDAIFEEDQSVLDEMDPKLRKAAEALAELMGKDKPPASRVMAVNAARFKSWLKKKIEAGHGQEIKDAGIFYGRMATLKEKS